MSNIINSLYNMRYLEDIAHKNTGIHKLNPVIKLITTVFYLIMVVSFDKYEIIRLLPFIIYPLVVILIAEIPVRVIIKRLFFIEPLIIGIGILNPLFDHKTILISGYPISGGWLIFISIVLKSSLTVTSIIVFIATTGMDKIAFSLRILKIPKIFVLQILLTYRYISVLMEEVARTVKAYSLRSFNQRGVQKKAWGSLLGQLILRTFDRAGRIYEAMCLRGFNGEYFTGIKYKFKLYDLLYIICWSAFFILSRLINIPVLLGTLITGVLK